jgi:predicted ester cyclase
LRFLFSCSRQRQTARKHGTQSERVFVRPTWAGIPPTGNPFSLPHLTIYEYEGKKIKKETIFMDNVTLFTQLGVMPAGELPPLVPSITLPDPEPIDLSPLQANAALVNGFNKGELAEWSKVFHKDAVIKYCSLQMIPMTREEYIALMELNLLGFPDVALEVTRAIDMGDGWVVSEFQSTGTQTGPYFGVPASDKFVVVRWGMVAQYGADGLVRDMGVYFDNMSIMVQIGAVQ